MLVTIIFRNSAAKMQRLNYFTETSLRLHIYQIISLIGILHQKGMIIIEILLNSN
jgi:hypothetical protein